MIKFIDFSAKHVLYQFAMLSFAVSTFVESKQILYISLIFAYGFLLAWEIALGGIITIDTVVWSVLFISVNLYKIYKLKDLNTELSES